MNTDSCAGGVAGYSKANILAMANPDAVVLLVAVELCSLTFLRNDFSNMKKTNNTKDKNFENQAPYKLSIV